MSRPDPADIIALALAQHVTMASAESLTGGGVSVAMTDAEGASAVWKGGLVAYDVGVKASVLKVPQRVLDTVGPVSTETALAMARGARKLLDTDIAVATTGVAGPEPHGGKSVGTVVIAVAGSVISSAEEFHFDGSRDQVVSQTVDAALTMLLSAVGGRAQELSGIREQL